MKIKTILSLSVSIITGGLGYIGLSGWCCSIAGGVFLSFLGLSSISTYLVYNSRIFIILSIIFFCLGILFFINNSRGKKNKTCLICKKIKN